MITKKIGIGILVILVLLQFIRPARNLGDAYTQNDIEHTVDVSAEVQQILNVSCYDCHSNSTIYPWYYSIQPVGLWLRHHINEGKGELNFSEFKSYTPKKQMHKLDELVEMVRKGEMPMNSYLWIHKDAVLSADQQEVLVKWAEESRATIQAANPNVTVTRK